MPSYMFKEINNCLVDWLVKTCTQTYCSQQFSIYIFIMAFSATNFMKTPSALEQLLEEINFQRTKEMRQLLKDGNNYI